MSLDPTLEDMSAFLRHKTSGLIDWRDCTARYEMNIAIHYFAGAYHNGQFSNLYQALCAVDYNQKDMELEDEPDENVHLMYDLLVKEYVK